MEAETAPFALTPPIEAWVDKDTKKYHLRMALPGVDQNKVELNLRGNILTISAERKASREAKEVDYLYRELSYGTFRRTLTLPEGVDTEKINAEYNNGLLEITAPMAAAALPRRVEIKGLPKAKAA
jgi:HSP20 family protein